VSVSHHKPAEVEPAPAGEEESSLIARVVSGEREAFDTLVRRHSPRLLRMTYALVGNQQDAEDLMQEAFAKAYFKIQSFSGRSSFFTWLYRITVNQSISNRRKRRLESTHHSVAWEDAPPPADEQATADAALQTDEEIARVREAIAALEEDRRTVLVLRDLEGLDYAEIAEVLAIPKGTVRSRLHRARGDLQSLLAKKHPDTASTPPPTCPRPPATEGES